MQKIRERLQKRVSVTNAQIAVDLMEMAGWPFDRYPCSRILIYIICPLNAVHVVHFPFSSLI